MPPSKPEPGKLGVPAGKLEIGETPEQAAKRELLEETGILVESSDIHGVGSLYIRKPQIDYVYHLFQISCKTKPRVRLSSEHSNYLWATQQEIETLPLMAGALTALQKYRSSLFQKKRITASVNVYLILQKEDQILLQLLLSHVVFRIHQSAPRLRCRYKLHHKIFVVTCSCVRRH